MPTHHIVRTTKVKYTPRLKQVESIFDVERKGETTVQWEVDLPLEEKPWHVGLIVGSSGSGKSTIGKELFKEHMITDMIWQNDLSIVDDFPKDKPIKEIIAALSSVGFSSPPNWMRPFNVLSNGEQFRTTLARAIIENNFFVIDEFTSVVDRTVAEIGSHAVAKAVRSQDKQMIAISCHHDIIEWLQPDWIYDTDEKRFTWRSLRRRPTIDLEISPCERSCWKMFRQHHYLSSDINPIARCFMGTVKGNPVAFTAVISFPHPRSPGYREHRTVVLPDYQGVGIGNAMSEFVAGIYRTKKTKYFSRTGHLAMIRHRLKSKLWKLTGKEIKVMNTNIKGLNKTVSNNRQTYGFQYVGKPLVEEAKLLFGG